MKNVLKIIWMIGTPIRLLVWILFCLMGILAAILCICGATPNEVTQALRSAFKWVTTLPTQEEETF
jgi:hypothetical protein